MMRRVLDKLRHPGRAKSIVAYILFGAIIIVFVFFFQSGPLTTMSGGGSAAIVNQQVIPISDFKTRVQRQEEQLGMRLDGLPDSQRQMFTESIRRRALEDLVMGEVLAQSAVKLGFTVSDGEVRDRIVEIPQFQEEGRFRRDRYEGLLRANRLDTREFEEKVRKDVLGQRVQETFSRAVYPLPVEIEKQKALKEEILNISFVEYGKDILSSKLKPSENEVKKYLESAEGQKAAESYYQKNKSNYIIPEQVRAQHILIKTQEGDKTSEEEALKKIKQIEERIAKNEEFGKLASELSEDEGSKIKQGELGFFSRGRMVKEFEEVAFKLKVGEVSGPVKTPFGFHLIKLNERKEAGEKSLDEVSHSIAEHLLVDDLFAKAREKIGELVKNGKEKPLSDYLKSVQLDWQETGEFNLSQTNIPKIGENEKLVQVALSLGKAGSIFPEILESSGKYYVVKLKELKLKKLESEDNSSKLEEPRFLALRRVGGIFEDWLTSQKEKFDISMNDQLLKTSSN